MKDLRCPLHPNETRIGLELTGGCCGDHGEDYCYCDSPDIHAVVFCNSPVCRYRELIVPGLTDMYAIERWINERYFKETK